MYFNDQNVTFMKYLDFEIFAKSRKVYKSDKPWVRKVDMFLQPCRVDHKSKLALLINLNNNQFLKMCAYAHIFY